MIVYFYSQNIQAYGFTVVKKYIFTYNYYINSFKWLCYIV